MSRRRSGPYDGPPDGSRRWPHGRTIGVPETTTVPARPWYPIGWWRQFGVSGSLSGRKIRPTLDAWCSEE
jgi:hypothetical protein